MQNMKNIKKKTLMKQSTLLLSAAAVFSLAASTAVAGGLPAGFEIIAGTGDGNWTASNNADDFQVTDTDLGAQISGFTQTDSWTAEWDSIVFSTNPTVTASFSFTNTTSMDQEFTVTVMTPISPIGGSTVMQGSIGGSLVDNPGNAPGATLAAPSGGAIYTALIDGNPVQTLHDDPFSFSVPDVTADSIPGASFSNVAGPPAFTSIGIQHTFFLSAGDSVTFSSAFTVIPTPATVAVFGLAGFFGSRRRRH